MPTPNARRVHPQHEHDATAAAADATWEHAPEQSPHVQPAAGSGQRWDTRLSVTAAIRNVSGRLRTAVDREVAEPLYAALEDLDAEIEGRPEANGPGRAATTGTRRARAVGTIRACIVAQLRAPYHPRAASVPLDVLADLAFVVQLIDIGSPKRPSTTWVREGRAVAERRE
jgi:hypothetical protein